MGRDSVELVFDPSKYSIISCVDNHSQKTRFLISEQSNNWERNTSHIQSCIIISIPSYRRISWVHRIQPTPPTNCNVSVASTQNALKRRKTHYFHSTKQLIQRNVVGKKRKLIYRAIQKMKKRYPREYQVVCFSLRCFLICINIF